MIEFCNVSKRYGKKTILDNLSFKVGAGEFVVLIGPSGCGKTTTLKMINRLIEPDGGKILIDGRDIAQGAAVELRRSIGYVIQQTGLFPNMTVEQNISVVPKLLKYDAQKCNEIVRELLALVNMPYDEYASKYPSQLSGGQQQRIGVLRALAASPPIVLMDEPFGALDPVTRGVLQDEIKRIQKKLGKTIVFVTHDMDEALRLADTIVFMDSGKILQMASPETMLQHPADDIIRSFMGKHIGNGMELTAADFMRERVFKVERTRHVLECVALMQRQEVNSLIAINDDGTYAGTVSIDVLRKSGRAGMPISELLTTTTITVDRDDNARAAFDQLIESNSDYIIVLNADKTIAGIITKTSMAKAMGYALWGEMS